MTSNEAKKIIDEMTSILFESADKIPEWDYIKLMNASNELFKIISNFDRGPTTCTTCEVVGLITRMGHQNDEVTRADLRNTRKTDLILICRSLQISHTDRNKEMLIDQIMNALTQS